RGEEAVARVLLRLQDAVLRDVRRSAPPDRGERGLVARLARRADAAGLPGPTHRDARAGAAGQLDGVQLAHAPLAARGRLMTLPNFVVIGAMKSATTTLAMQLAAQEGVFVSDPKEPNFFSNDEIYSKGMSWYESLFAGAEG